MTIKDGGPAFPLKAGQLGTLGNTHGMSLRDYFAAKVIHGIMMKDVILYCKSHLDSDSTPENMSARAYKIADAMLSEREKSK